MAKKSQSNSAAANRPEKKIGPYPGGIGVAIWLNEIETDNGPRKLRSITISPRRYRDPETGEWRDSSSYRPGDLPALVFALNKALDYMFSTPIPGEEEAGENEPF